MASERTVQDDSERVNSDSTQFGVRLQCNLGAGRYIIFGGVTENRYEFNGAGAILSVAEEDVPSLLAKKLSRSCCAGTLPGTIFTVLGV